MNRANRNRRAWTHRIVHAAAGVGVLAALFTSLPTFPGLPIRTVDAQNRVPANNREAIDFVDRPDERPNRGGGDTDEGPTTHYFRVQAFRRGDFNVDGGIDVSDASAIFNWLFLGGQGTTCLNAGDTNKDAKIDLSDGSFLLNWLFLGGPMPAAPGPHRCGIDPEEKQLSCEMYDPCPDELPLITHVLNRITFGPTEALLTEIQTRDDLIAYLEDQLSPPPLYNQSVHEPELAALIDILEIGFNTEGATPSRQETRLPAMLFVDALVSRWQLLHKLSVFWNNHFHTQITTLRNNVFGRGPVGGGAARPNAQQFQAADADGSGGITEAEWARFREDHPGVIPYSDFARVNRNDPSQLVLEEYMALNTVSYWKYGRGAQQFGVSADMERREYDAFRRHAFDRFENLLHMHAKSVAQVIYLNNYENTVVAPNENYGREYFELFALGADHVYTQRDIEQVSKVFTAWNIGWHLKEIYEPEDILRIRHPEARIYPLNLREPRPFRFAIPQFWDDELYTWGFHFGHPQRDGSDGHDWGRKDLFLPQYGGVDSLGNSIPTSAAVRIPANIDNRTVSAAMREFDLVLAQTVAFRDCPKFISTKLIQYFVTDDLSLLARDADPTEELAELFENADLDGDEFIEREEWDEPTPDLPTGKPPEIFERLDLDGDDRISIKEYKEPDLLLAAIAAWQETNGDIGAVLRAILLSDEFLSMKFARAKVKDPFEVVTSTIRGTNAPLNLNQLYLTMLDMRLAGMEHFLFADPTGESELGFDWMHTVGLLERLKYVNRAINPATANESRAVFDPAVHRDAWSLSNAAQTVEFYTLQLLGGDILENQRLLAERAFATGGITSDVRARAALAYLLSLPQFQKQ